MHPFQTVPQSISLLQLPTQDREGVFFIGSVDSSSLLFSTKTDFANLAEMEERCICQIVIDNLGPIQHMESIQDPAGHPFSSLSYQIGTGLPYLIICSNSGAFGTVSKACLAYGVRSIISASHSLPMAIHCTFCYPECNLLGKREVNEAKRDRRR